MTMERILEPERSIPVVADVEVLVCGGGVAGVAAAVCAARGGVKTMLLERYGFLGGLAINGLVITTPPLDNGINREICETLRRRRVYARCENSGETIEMNAYDPEILKHELVRMLGVAGVDLLLHVYITRALLDQGALTGVIMETKAGRQAVRARCVIDATGDADVAASAAVPFRLVKKPMTMMFNLVGVDTERALVALEGNWRNVQKVVQRAIEAGELEFDLSATPNFGSPGVSLEKLVHEGQLNVWSGNLLDMDGTDPRDLTHAEIVTREHTMRLAEFLRVAVPGFERSRIECTATQVGVRATRQVLGEGSPTLKEVQGCVFEGTVVKPYTNLSLRLPYGSLVPQQVENLLVAGRCISAEEEAMAQLRLIPVCLATGQAAGTAAAMAVQQGVQPRRLQVKQLQAALAAQGVALGLG